MSARPMTVDALMAAAFGVPRDPRSPEYKAGVRAALAFRIDGIKIRCPHPMGTAQADAFYSGVDEGRRRWREAVEAARPSTAREPQFL